MPMRTEFIVIAIAVTAIFIAWLVYGKRNEEPIEETRQHFGWTILNVISTIIAIFVVSGISIAVYAVIVAVYRSMREFFSF